jgi:hypothetical protein
MANVERFLIVGGGIGGSPARSPTTDTGSHPELMVVSMGDDRFFVLVPLGRGPAPWPSGLCTAERPVEAG